MKKQINVNWIIAKQLGRRNATEEQKSYWRGKRYLAERKPEGNQPVQKEQVRGTTRSRLAKEYQLSESTIYRDAQFAEAVDRLESDDKVAVFTGQSGLSKREVASGVTPGNGSRGGQL